MVEHRIDQHSQTARMARVDEPDQAGGAAVGLVDAVPEHTVISPAVSAGKGVHRHQLDEVDPEIDQVVQLLDGGVKCARGGEGADMQLVDHRAGHGATGPGVVGPGGRGGVPQLGAGMHPIGLAGRSGVGQHLGVIVEQKSVAGSWRSLDRGVPPAVVGAPHRVHAALDI